MKLILERWRHFISEQEPDGAGGFIEFETVGDLRKAISQATKTKNLKDIGKSGVEVASSVSDASTLGVLPVLRLLWKKSQKDPGLAKSNPVLNKLMIDPEVSKVVDDKIEGRFLQDIAKAIEGKNDNERLEDMDMTRLLAKYIKKDYDGTVVKPKE